MYDATVNVYTMIYQFIPRLIAALLVFLVGMMIANWVKRLVVGALHSLKLNVLTERSQLQLFLEKAEFKSKLEDILGRVAKWVVVILFAVASINILGLTTVSSVLNTLLGYLPRVVSAIFILGLGVFLAGVVERLIKGAVAQFDVQMGRLLSKIASYLMVIIAAMAAFNELGIAKELINILFIGLVATLSLGFGLAIGLGAKDLVAEMLKEWYTRFRQEVKKTESNTD